LKGGDRDIKSGGKIGCLKKKKKKKVETGLRPL